MKEKSSRGSHPSAEGWHFPDPFFSYGNHELDFSTLFILLLLAALGGFWLHSLRILEIARDAAKKACIRADVQFLDDTVASTSMAMTRDHSGRRIFRRSYRFEFSETGDSRIEGQVLMLGNSVESVTMDAYRIMP